MHYGDYLMVLYKLAIHVRDEELIEMIKNQGDIFIDISHMDDRIKVNSELFFNNDNAPPCSLFDDSRAEAVFNIRTNLYAENQNSFINLLDMGLNYCKKSTSSPDPQYSYYIDTNINDTNDTLEFNNTTQIDLMIILEDNNHNKSNIAFLSIEYDSMLNESTLS